MSASSPQARARLRSCTTEITEPPGVLHPGGNQVKDLLLVGKVQVIGRLVQEEQLRVLRQELRQECALQLAARQRQDGMIPKGRHAGDGERLFYLRLVVRAGFREQPVPVGVAAHRTTCSTVKA
jgi:hypothetical protein